MTKWLIALILLSSQAVQAQKWYHSSSFSPPYQLPASLSLSRAGHQAVAYNGSILVFGGFEYTTNGNSSAASRFRLTLSRNDLPAFTLFANTFGATNQWAPALFQGNAPPARYFHVMELHPTDNYALLHGGIGASGYTLSDVWALDLTNLLWISLNTSSFALSSHSMSFSPVLGSFLIYGGVTINGTATASTTLYEAKLSRTPTTILLNTIKNTGLAGGPQLCQHSSIHHLDSTTGTGFLILYGGMTSCGGILTDAGSTPRINIVTCPRGSSSVVDHCTWSTFVSSISNYNNYLNRAGHDAVYNPVAQEMVVQGGLYGASGGGAPTVILSMPGAQTSTWFFRSVNASVERGRASMYFSLSTVQLSGGGGSNVSYVVRYGGMNRPFPQSNFSAVLFSNSIEYAYFYSTTGVQGYVVPSAGSGSGGAVASKSLSPSTVTSTISMNAATNGADNGAGGGGGASSTAGIVNVIQNTVDFNSAFTGGSYEGAIAAGIVLGVVLVLTVLARTFPNAAKVVHLDFLL